MDGWVWASNTGSCTPGAAVLVNGPQWLFANGREPSGRSTRLRMPTTTGDGMRAASFEFTAVKNPTSTKQISLKADTAYGAFASCTGSTISGDGVDLSTGYPRLILNYTGFTPETPIASDPTLNVPGDETIHVGDPFDPMAGVKATAGDGTDLTGRVTVKGQVDNTRAGSYTLEYTVVDDNGGEATANRAITVIDTAAACMPVTGIPWTGVTWLAVGLAVGLAGVVMGLRRRRA